jgi:hypothetical protein
VLKGFSIAFAPDDDDDDDDDIIGGVFTMFDVFLAHVTSPLDEHEQRILGACIPTLFLLAFIDEKDPPPSSLCCPAIRVLFTPTLLHRWKQASNKRRIWSERDRISAAKNDKMLK